MAKDCRQMDPLEEIRGWHSGESVFVCVMADRGTGGAEKQNGHWRGLKNVKIKAEMEADIK